MSCRAISNNDIACVAWNYNTKIDNCLGFAVYRIDLNAKTTTALSAWVGFQGESNQNWQPKTTVEWPVQKFNWRDLTAKRGGFYQYQVVPMVGTRDQLNAKNDLMLTSNPVNLSPNRGKFSAYFNRGILSTQYLAHQLPEGPSGSPSYIKLKDRIDQPGDPLRNSLSGDIREALMLLLERAKKEGGQCYGAIYELTDPELEQLLIGCPYVHLVLSNAPTDDSENQSARQAMHESNTDVTDRILPNGHIGHNKSMVFVDSKGVSQAVLAGSTNWTATGLCGQSNNAIIIESQDVAGHYFDYWTKLKDDSSSPQGQEFRSFNNEPRKVVLDDKTEVTIWFSPNTRATNKTADSPMPSDMEQVFDVMSKAKKAILFLVFQPGTPSIVDQAAKCQNDNPDLFVHGAVTDPKAVDEFNTQLYHRSGNAPDCTVVAASAIKDQFSFWHQELLKSSPTAHAIIHDKIVVVDPFSPDCAVVTGSHNLGYRASYNNDENLLIIRGNQALAEAYCAHILDVYDHYRWRYWIQKAGTSAWSGLQTNDSWQDPYFKDGSEHTKEFRFWFGK